MGYYLQLYETFSIGWQWFSNDSIKFWATVKITGPNKYVKDR